MSALPFDSEHDDAIVECVRLASLEQLGREMARRAGALLDQAEAAWQQARRSTDPLDVGSAAMAAQSAAEWCTRVAQAAQALIGTGDVELVKETMGYATAAHRCASNAEAAWRRCKEERGAYHA